MNEDHPHKVETKEFVFDVLERNWDTAKVAITQRSDNGKTLHVPMADLKRFMAAYMRWHKKQIIHLQTDEQVLGM